MQATASLYMYGTNVCCRLVWKAGRVMTESGLVSGQCHSPVGTQSAQSAKQVCRMTLALSREFTRHRIAGSRQQAADSRQHSAPSSLRPAEVSDRLPSTEEIPASSSTEYGSPSIPRRTVYL